MLQGQNVLWHTDNMAAATIIKVGSNKPKLQELASKIFETSREKGLNLKVTWIARDKNYDADLINKTMNYDDWTVNHKLFEFLQNTWGIFTIDLFADNFNNKCKKFCSRYWCPNTYKVDAFSFDWSGEFCYMVPPPYLIVKSIKHFLASERKVWGVLIVPYWTSANYWPFLVRHNKEFKTFIKDFRYFSDTKCLLSKGKYEGSLIGDENINVPFYALLISN